VATAALMTAATLKQNSFSIRNISLDLTSPSEKQQQLL